MMEFSLVILDFLHYVLCYRILYGVRYTKKTWKYIVVGIILLASLGLLKATAIEDAAMYICQLFSGLLIPLFLCEKRKLMYAILYIPVISLDVLVGYVFSFLLGILYKMPGQSIMGEHELWVEVMSLVFFVLLYLLLRKRINSSRTEKSSPDVKSVVFYFIVFICSVFSLGGASGLTKREFQDDVLTLNFFGLGITLSCLILLFFCYWFEILGVDIEKEKAKTRAYETFGREQQKQIEAVIANDERIRRAQHDFKSHLIELQALVENDDFDAVRKYCKRMIGEDLRFSGISYTGDTAVDAMIHYYLEVAEKKEITVKCNITPGHIDVSYSYDLCTILSNLLSNAIEAQEELIEKRLEFVMYHYIGKFFIIIKNPCKERPIEEGGVLVTTKEDMTNHGFGSVSVKDTVDKYGGSVTYKYLDGIFEAAAVVPINDVKRV